MLPPPLGILDAALDLRGRKVVSRLASSTAVSPYITASSSAVFRFAVPRLMLSSIVTAIATFTFLKVADVHWVDTGHGNRHRCGDGLRSD